MKLTIIGASGHGKVVADIAQLNGYDEIQFLDDDASITECAGYSVVGKSSDANEIDGEFFVAVGNAAIRKRLMKQLSSKRFPLLAHPKAVIASKASIGDGSVIMAGAVINSYASLGMGCIVNTCASVDHDCAVGDFCHVSVGARLCGTVTIGDETWIGAGAVVINNTSVCTYSIVGAGAVVTKDILIPGTYVGVPARRLMRDRKFGGGGCSQRPLVPMVACADSQIRRAA